MKRIIFVLLLLFSVFFGYTEEYNIKAISGNQSKEILNGELVSLKKAESFIIIDSSCYIGFNENNIPYLITDTDRQLCIDDIYHKDSDNFDKSLISNGSKQDKLLYLPEYFLEALYYKDFTKIDNYNAIHPQIPHSYYKYITDYLRHEAGNFPIISNLMIGFMSGEQLVVKKIKKVNNSKYNCECIYSYSGGFDLENPYHTLFYPLLLDYFEINDAVTIEISIDNDYLILKDKKRNKVIIKLFKANQTIIDECINLYDGKQINIKNITWPRHADGACDYDDNSKSPKTAVSTTSTTPTASTNVTVNKTMSVTENLKLRSGEATTTSVLTVMSTGTKVKILELGKAENIDGIDSNWVKVEVQKGAKDRDGKEIKAAQSGGVMGAI